MPLKIAAGNGVGLSEPSPAKCPSLGMDAGEATDFSLVLAGKVGPPLSHFGVRPQSLDIQKSASEKK